MILFGVEDESQEAGVHGFLPNKACGFKHVELVE
jgi:hypothetical protein